MGVNANVKAGVFAAELLPTYALVMIFSLFRQV